MTRLLARTPAMLVATLSALWIIGLIALPAFYLRSKGWGHYWAFSFGEILPSLLLLFGPPAFLVIFWYRARRRSDTKGAV